MRSFRIIPRQVNSRPDETHARYGFFIEDHPRGDPNHDFVYLASWDDLDTAMSAAICLGMDPHQVEVVTWVTAKDWGMPI